MEYDHDLPVPSIEPQSRETTPTTHTIDTTPTNISSRTGSAGNSSLSQTPYKTPRSRPATPGSSVASRSPSVASVRNVRSTPSLDRKKSLPNLTTSRGATPSHQPQFRRMSSNLNPATPVRIRSVTPGSVPEKQKMTPALVAKDYFSRELATHDKRETRTIVYVHDACYGHRFSRRNSTKVAIASIVERPERIHATLLGASTAYVRLGDRHKEGRYYPHPNRDVSAAALPFKIRKTTRSIPLNHPAVVHVHGTKWMDELQVMCDSAEARLAIGAKELQRPMGYGKDEKGNKLPELHSGDLYLAKESLSALQGCLGGVCDAVDTVFGSSETQRAFVCIRPPGHHCSADMPSGFCWLNNVHVGISYGAMNHGLTHAAIIDFDLHHGDGSQAITWSHNQTAQTLSKNASAHKKIPIGYYSLHDINSYPCEAGDPEKILNASTCLHNAHGQSIWNVHLESYASLVEFWATYDVKYKKLLEKAESFLAYHSAQLRDRGIEPKAAIFLSSGFDASEHETPHMQRHGVNVPTEFYAKFTADVVRIAEKSTLGVGGRIISVLEGGYSDRALTSGVLSHICGLTETVEAESSTNVLPSLSPLTSNIIQPGIVCHDPAWWSPYSLECLEAMVAGKIPPPKTDTNNRPPGSYSSPTQASISRMTETAQERQSLSAQLEAKLWLQNAPPEPVPEVDWLVAAYELSRLLIPEDRQTLSCTYEELNVESVRARKDRQSLLSTTSPPGEKMQLRDRRTRQVIPAAPQPRPASKSSRRTTIASAFDLPDPSARDGNESRPRRRSSAASSVLSTLQDLRIDDQKSSQNNRTNSEVPTKAVLKDGAILPVKKTRVPTKKPASTTNSPRKGRSAAKLGELSENPFNATQPTSLPVTSRSRPTTSSGSDAMDELTNGLKKISIKLKMPTEEQYAARQKVAQGTDQAKTKTSRKPPIPKIPKLKTVTSKITADLPSNIAVVTNNSSLEGPNTVLTHKQLTADSPTDRPVPQNGDIFAVPPNNNEQQSQTLASQHAPTSQEIQYPHIKAEEGEPQFTNATNPAQGEFAYGM